MHENFARHDDIKVGSERAFGVTVRTMRLFKKRGRIQSHTQNIFFRIITGILNVRLT